MNDNELLQHIFIKKGDITSEESDAIVNAANTSLLGGGGVDGAIHMAAGIKLLEECRKLGGCKTGEAKITKGYNLKAKYIIHTPGPIYIDGKNKEPEMLRYSYRNSLLIIKEQGLKSVSFPAISTGVYRFPRYEAAKIAIETVLSFMDDEKYIVDVSFVLFDNDNFDIYKKIIEGLKNELH